MTKKLIATLLAACMALLPVLALADGTLNVLNYGEYIDEQVWRNFAKEYNIKVNYDKNDTPESM